MGQATAVTVTTDERRWSLMLRPLLLLGGFALVWWFLLTGSAQAAGGPDRDLAETAREATGNVERVVDREVRQQDRAPVEEVTRTVRRHVAPVVSPVAAPVASAAKQTVENNVKPVTTRATDPVRATVHKVTKGLRSGLENGTGNLPELQPAELVVPPLLVGESSTRVGETRSTESEDHSFATASQVLPVVDDEADLGAPLTTVFADQNSAPSDSQDTVGRTPLGGQSSDGAIHPAGHDGAASVQSGSGSGPVPALAGSGFAIAPAITKTSTLSSVDRLPAGPAYPPAASPD